MVYQQSLFIGRALIWNYVPSISITSKKISKHSKPSFDTICNQISLIKCNVFFFLALIHKDDNVNKFPLSFFSHSTHVATFKCHSLQRGAPNFLRDVSLFSVGGGGGGRRATILGGRLIIFFPLVCGSVTIFLRFFRGGS